MERVPKQVENVIQEILLTHFKGTAIDAGVARVEWDYQYGKLAVSVVGETGITTYFDLLIQVTPRS